MQTSFLKFQSVKLQSDGKLRDEDGELFTDQQFAGLEDAEAFMQVHGFEVEVR